jgi:hypothetical protein
MCKSAITKRHISFFIIVYTHWPLTPYCGPRLRWKQNNLSQSNLTKAFALSACPLRKAGFGAVS